MIGDIKALVEFQTKLQGVANSISKEMIKTLDASDRELLDTIRKGLAKPFNGKSLEESMKRLKALCDQVYAIRKKAIENAKNVIVKYEKGVAKSSAKQAANYCKNITKKQVKPLSKKRVDDIIQFQPFQGRSIANWLDSWKESDKYRIVSAIQQAVNNGITPQKAIDIIRGTKANGYKDGVLNVSRSSASMIARTITNGVSNEARLATLDENEDVIDGIQFLATLDGRTSFVCASLDGKIWRNNERDQVKRPPLHPNCRSTLIPYIELRDRDGNIIEDTTDRAAASEDFVQKAKERYEANHPGKKWDDLAASTRDKYYYKEQEIYDANNGGRGASWNHVPASTTFKDYLESQPEDFQRSWLGEKRFELYKEGKLKFENLVNPDSGYLVPLEELQNNQSSSVNSTGNTEGSEYNNGSSQANSVSKPLGRTATELNLKNPILTVDDFKRKFADKQAIYDQEKTRLEDELKAECQRIDDDNSLTEQEKNDEKDNKKERYELIQKELLDRHRDNMFDTIWPDLNPNSKNRERLATEQMSNERFIPLKPTPGGTPRWYDIKRENTVFRIPTSARARILDHQPTEYQECFKKGKEFFGRIADSMGYDATTAIEEHEIYGIVDRGYRSVKLNTKRDNNKNIIVLSGWGNEREKTSVVTHELTHALESKYPELRSRIALFYEQITTQPDGTRNIKRRIRGTDEYYREATIHLFDDYKGKYALKDYGTGGEEGKELLTMFFTEMIERPEEVIEKCPEWFNGMMNCLKQ